MVRETQEEFHMENKFLFIGALGAFFMAIAAMLIGMPAKIYFMNHVSSALLATFIISMVIKNFGIIFMGVGLLTEAWK